MRLSATLLLFVLLALPAFAQEPCEPGVAFAQLDASGVKVELINTGDIVRNSAETEPFTGYEVPRGSGLAPLFTASVWVGGYVEESVRVVGSYGFSGDFAPGPLERAEAPPADCAAYDRIWTVTSADVAALLADGVVRPSVADWPFALGAPVVDGDGDPSTYDPAGGDYPEVRGAQTAFWVMHAARPTTFPESAPLGVEVQALAWVVPSEDEAIDRSTFYRYRVVNRNVAPIDSLTLTLHSTTALGVQFDDWLGSDPERNMAFWYNATDEDELYGTAPPALGWKLLDAEAAALTSHGNDAVTNPVSALEYWHYMRGRWVNGMPFTYGGYGEPFDDREPYPFLFPDEPGTYWSAACPTPDCNGSVVGPRWSMVSTVPARLEPGAARDYSFSIIYARGNDHYDSVAALKVAADRIQRAFDDGSILATEADTPPEGLAFALGAPHPNPSSGRLAVSYTFDGSATATLAAYDVLGRRVWTERLVASGDVALDVSGWAPGVYLLRLEAGGEVAVRRFTVAR
jgi:hypothetical protein